MSCWSLSRSLAFDTSSILCSSRVSFCFPESWGFWSSVTALSVLSFSSGSQIAWMQYWANSKHWVWVWVVVQLVRWCLHRNCPSSEPVLFVPMPFILAHTMSWVSSYMPVVSSGAIFPRAGVIVRARSSIWGGTCFLTVTARKSIANLLRLSMALRFQYTCFL